VRTPHRAYVERPDLIVVEVGRDEALRGAQLVDHVNRRAPDIATIEVRSVRSEVVSHRCEDQRILTEQA